MMLPTNDLRRTKAAFIKEVLRRMEAEPDSSAPLLSRKEKHEHGTKMWMASRVRSVLIMSKGPGFACVTTRD